MLSRGTKGLISLGFAACFCLTTKRGMRIVGSITKNTQRPQTKRGQAHPTKATKPEHNAKEEMKRKQRTILQPFFSPLHPPYLAAGILVKPFPPFFSLFFSHPVDISTVRRQEYVENESAALDRICLDRDKDWAPAEKLKKQLQGQDNKAWQIAVHFPRREGKSGGFLDESPDEKRNCHVARAMG